MSRYETALLPLVSRMRQKAHCVCTGSIQRDYLLPELENGGTGLAGGPLHQLRRLKIVSSASRTTISAPRPRPKKRGALLMWSISQPEVLAEEAGDEPERQEDRRDHGELLDDRVETVGNGREVDVHRPGHEVAVLSIRSLIRIRWS